ncbi:MAG: hypothetical protein PUP91_39010, partial [Rhizonema sp. PD37]|nr:hypothetical protein [Rhizonema sp. PD37]
IVIVSPLWNERLQELECQGIKQIQRISKVLDRVVWQFPLNAVSNEFVLGKHKINRLRRAEI